MPRLLLAVTLALAAVGCTHEPVRPLPDLVGQPFDAAVERFGTPAIDQTLDVQKGENLMEVRSGLYAAVLDTLADGGTASVREGMWEEPNRAVWAVQRDGRWTVVDALEWDDDVQF